MISDLLKLGAPQVPTSLAVRNPYQSVGQFFQLDTSNREAPSTINPASPNEHCHLFRFRSPFTSQLPSNNELVPVIPPPANNELVPVFPLCDDDDYDYYVAPHSINLGTALLDIAGDTPSTYNATPTTNSTSTASPTATMFSTYNYAARCDVFSISIPERVQQIIISNIIAIS